MAKTDEVYPDETDEVAKKDEVYPDETAKAYGVAKTDEAATNL